LACLCTRRASLAKAADDIGLDGVLLGHPTSFYPQSEKELYDYTEYVCNRTDLGVVGFAQPHWNFQRLHPSGYPAKERASCGSGPA
jgi:4-hydroxy-tetrahydrodipicolinate synthase